MSYRNDLAPDLAIIRIQPEDASPVPEFRAGQFVTLGLRFDGEERITYRAYSISSPPEERHYFELYIKLAREPVMGKFTSALFDMKLGDTIYWRKPAGAFTIEEKRPDGSPENRRMVLVASGTGLAPFVSYVLHLKNIDSNRQVALLHGAKYAKELGYSDIFQDLSQNNNFLYLPTVSRPGDALSKGWLGSTGRVESLLVRNGGKSTLEEVLGEDLKPEKLFFYICGYQGTISAVTDILSPLGFVTNRNKRKDGSFDIKIETYG